MMLSLVGVADGWSVLGTVMVALIGAIPSTIIAVAVYRSARTNRRNLETHVTDEGVTSEAIMSYLEKLAEAAGITGVGGNSASPKP